MAALCAGPAPADACPTVAPRQGIVVAGFRAVDTFPTVAPTGAALAAIGTGIAEIDRHTDRGVQPQVAAESAVAATTVAGARTFTPQQSTVDKDGSTRTIGEAAATLAPVVTPMIPQVGLALLLAHPFRRASDPFTEMAGKTVADRLFLPRLHPTREGGPADQDRGSPHQPAHRPFASEPDRRQALRESIKSLAVHALPPSAAGRIHAPVHRTRIAIGD
jgi:hypothetical protein